MYIKDISSNPLSKHNNCLSCLLACFLRYVPLENISLPWWLHHWRWWDAEFRSLLLHTYDIWAGRDLYRAIPALTQDLGFCGLVLSYPKEDPNLVAFCDRQGIQRIQQRVVGKPRTSITLTFKCQRNKIKNIKDLGETLTSFIRFESNTTSC